MDTFNQYLEYFLSEEYLFLKYHFKNSFSFYDIYDKDSLSMISKEYIVFKKENLINFKQLISIFNEIDTEMIHIDEKYHHLLIEMCRKFVNVNNLPLLKYLFLTCKNSDAEYIICTMYKGILSYQHIGFVFKQNKICGKWKKISNYAEQFERYLENDIIYFIKYCGFYVGSNVLYGEISLKYNGMWISR